MVPVESSELTGSLTCEDRRGTVVDWNLCFNADGTASSRTFKSGTPAFMSPALLGDEHITRRTLAHDMESFFSVIIWIATLDYEDEVAFLAKPLARNLLDKKKSPEDILHAKSCWFEVPKNFELKIIDHFELVYRKDRRFVACLSKLRQILYPGTKDGEAGNADPMKEGLFRMCMKEMDDYLQETKGCDEMHWIDSHTLAAHTPGSLAGGNADMIMPC